MAFFESTVDAVVAAEPKKRSRPRARNTRINESDVFVDLENIAMLPLPEVEVWHWDGKHYGKPSRNLAPEITALENSSSVLKVLCAAAPNGYPDSGRAPQCLDEASQNVWHPRRSQQRAHARVIEAECGQAAAVWKCMMKHLIDLEKHIYTEVPEGDVGLHECLKLLILPIDEADTIDDGCDGVPVEELHGAFFGDIDEDAAADPS